MKNITFQVSVSNFSCERGRRGQEIGPIGSQGGFPAQTVPERVRGRPENFPVLLKHDVVEVERTRDGRRNQLPRESNVNIFDLMLTVVF